MLELRTLLLAMLRSAVRGRNDLVIENLLLRHHLAVLVRPGGWALESLEEVVDRATRCS